MTHHNQQGQMMEDEGEPGYTAKSVIFDFADNYGDAVLMGIRSAEFKAGGSLIPLAAVDFTAYHTTAASSRFFSALVFITALSKVGSQVDDGWGSSFVITNQRIIVVLNSPIIFDELVVNNYHHFGTDTDRGIKNTKIHVSTDAITSTIYDSAISNSTLIFNGQITEHVADDVADDEILTLL